MENAISDKEYMDSLKAMSKDELINETMKEAQKLIGLFDQEEALIDKMKAQAQNALESRKDFDEMIAETPAMALTEEARRFHENMNKAQAFSDKAAAIEKRVVLLRQKVRDNVLSVDRDPAVQEEYEKQTKRLVTAYRNCLKFAGNALKEQRSLLQMENNYLRTSIDQLSNLG